MFKMLIHDTSCYLYYPNSDDKVTIMLHDIWNMLKNRPICSTISIIKEPNSFCMVFIKTEQGIYTNIVEKDNCQTMLSTNYQEFITLKDII